MLMLQLHDVLMLELGILGTIGPVYRGENDTGMVA